MNIYTHVDFRGHITKSLRIEHLAGNPAEPLSGLVWSNTLDDIPYIRAGGLSLPLIAKDDTFHETPDVGLLADDDKLSIWDKSAQPSYRHGNYRSVTFQALKEQIGEANAYLRHFIANEGVPVGVDENNDFAIVSGQSFMKTRIPENEHKILIEFNPQLQGHFLAGPSSGGAAPVSFRKITLSDLPEGVGASSWNDLDDIPDWLAHVSQTSFQDGHVHDQYEPVLGNPLADDHVLSSTAAGVRSWIATVNEPAGNNYEIQYNNAGTFGSSPNLSYIDNELVVNNVIRSPHFYEYGGYNGQNLIIQAGNAENISGTAGSLYLSSGQPRAGTVGVVYLGFPGYASSIISLKAAGTATNINLHIAAKGSGTMAIGTGNAEVAINSTSFVVTGNNILLGSYANGKTSVRSGADLELKGGLGWSLEGGNGGNLLLYGGDPDGTGLRGNVYFGDKTTGFLTAKTTETNAVYYDTATGKISYGLIEAGADEFLYTNPATMPTKLGGLPAGSSFSNQTMQQMLDNLLYEYLNPAFSSFAMSSQAVTLECGVNLFGGSRAFSWGTTNSGNVKPDSLSISDVTAPATLASGLANTGSATIGIGGNITKLTTNATHVWRIAGLNTKDEAIAVRNFTVTWYSPIYHGVGAPALTVGNIQALSKNVVAKSSYTRSFSPVSQVYYYAYPASYGLLTSIKDTNNFEIIDDFTVRTENFTTNSPYYEGTTVSYYIYEFKNLTSQTGFNITFIF